MALRNSRALQIHTHTHTVEYECMFVRRYASVPTNRLILDKESPIKAIKSASIASDLDANRICSAEARQAVSASARGGCARALLGETFLSFLIIVSLHLLPPEYCTWEDDVHNLID